MRHRGVMIRYGGLRGHANARRTLPPDGSILRPSPADLLCAGKRKTAEVERWGADLDPAPRWAIGVPLRAL
jgi:hypothetical protein